MLLRYLGKCAIVTDIAQKDKNEAKRTKPSMGMERVQEIEAEGEFILRNMEMEPDIENITMSEYLEYEANKSNTFYYSYSHDIPPPPVQSYPQNYLVSAEDSICEQDDDLEDDQEEVGDDRDILDMWDIMVEDEE
ncbi:hypothetical protein Tco_0864739 [Tanacetum coccineum]